MNICPLLLEPSCHLPPFPTPPYPSRLLQSPSVNSLNHSKFPLAIYFTYNSIFFHATLSIHLTLSYLPPPPLPTIDRKSVLSVYVSITAVQTGSSVPAIPLLGIYPEETKTEKDTYTPMVIAVHVYST